MANRGFVTLRFAALLVPAAALGAGCASQQSSTPATIPATLPLGEHVAGSSLIQTFNDPRDRRWTTSLKVPTARCG